MTREEIREYVDKRTNQLSLIRRSRSLSLDDFTPKDILVVIEFWDFLGVKAILEVFERPLDAYLFMFDIKEEIDNMGKEE